MKYKELFRFSEDLVSLAEILFYSWEDSTSLLVIYFVGFIFGSTLQGISSFQQRFSNNTKLIFLYSSYAIKGVVVWASTQQNISVSLNIHLILQLYFCKDEELKEKEMSYYALFLISINTFNYITITTDSYIIFAFDFILIVLDAKHLQSLIYENLQKQKYQLPVSTEQTTTHQQKMGQTFQFDVQSIKSPKNITNNLIYDKFASKKLIFNTKLEIFECSVKLDEFQKLESKEKIILNSHDSIKEQFFNLNLLYKHNEIVRKIKVEDYISEHFEELSNIYYYSIEENDIFDFKDIVLLIEQTKNSVCEHLITFIFLDVPQKFQRKQGRVRKQLFFDMCRHLTHELGTNLNSIITFSNLASEDEGISEQIKNTYIYPILVNSLQLNLIINNIRDFTQIGLQIFKTKMQEILLTEMIDYINNLFEESLQNKGIQLHVTYQLKNRIFVTDRERFEQVYFQLLQNAVKYTISGQIRVNIYNNSDKMILSIEDTGIGIKEEEEQNLNYLLEKDEFIKVSETSIGAGIGLVIANMIVKQMNRGIRIKFTRLLIGTQFYFELPNITQNSTYLELKTVLDRQFSSQSIKFITQNSYIEGPLGQTSRQLSNSITSQRNGKRKKRKETKSISIVHHFEDEVESDDQSQSKKARIQILPIFFNKLRKDLMEYCLQSTCCERALIVDDEYFNIQCLKLIMSKLGVKCSQAYNGLDALTLVKQKKQNPCQTCKNSNFLLVFLDINMPIMDGFQTVLQIKQLINEEQIKKTICIATTGYSDVLTKIKSYESGMDYFLTKPLNQNVLKDILLQFFPTLANKMDY